MHNWDDDNPWGKWGKKCYDPGCGEEPGEDGFDSEDTCDFDQTALLLHKIIKALCILKREIAKCEEILCNPKFGLKEIKREVRNIERGVFSPTFGLPEIKAEVSTVQTIVGGIMDMLDNPTFGLPEIKAEVSDILAIVSNLNLDFPVTLLSDIKSEVSAIEAAVFSPTYGLPEIKAEVSQILANQSESPLLTTGPFTVDCNELTMLLKALNNTATPQSVTFVIRNLTNCPTVAVSEVGLAVPACCSEDTEVAIPGSGQRNIEVRASRSSADGVLVYLATKTGMPFSAGSKVNEFKHAEWVPVATFCS
ncbi:hypothetical protein [Desulforamulus hydrothermalis]|uniref:Uncharacterized protein n=1 Tax=Desulforamulus hydrothermalis Lam5 = DSM 18033 TaxID=1121428 RepID=K8E7C3_9FIRM|nr:hypothetical protein [Desulforamulus hydrothermalis]CCO07378.1 conserved hypothetical protein [Desulforamulus hydrothermalis Lam5 = DSM 18033]SHH41576.1 hypothetical protein SAMN02745177_02481 [Desulforamulus hydrothermalis Lam5 = DSM 18033]